MTCATSTLKFTVIVFNTLCAIFGAVMLTASGYSLINFVGSNSIRIPCIIGVTLGGLLFLATIIGCCGAIRESTRTIWSYAVFLFILMGAQIGVIFLLPMDFNKLAEETIDNAWHRQLIDMGPMSTYETQYGCCGKVGPNDYAISGLRIPPSCYVNGDPNIASDLFTQGCVDRLAEAFSLGTRIEIISDWSLVGVEVATIILAGMLAISLKNMKRRRLYH